MSFQKVECFILECDNCGEVYRNEHTGYSIWVTESDCYDDAQEDGWYEEDEKYYCPLCHFIDEEDNIILNKTIGKIITEAINLHELNPETVGKTLDFPDGVITKLMSDEFYTNSVPVVLFKNLIMSLHIPFSTIEKAIIPTFNLLKSKETSETIKKKPHGYELWENKESVIKYTNRLKELMQNQP